MCKHNNTVKVMEIPITEGELDYNKLNKSVNKIINNVKNHEWCEMLLCLDCETILEVNKVFNPSNTPQR